MSKEDDCSSQNDVKSEKCCRGAQEDKSCCDKQCPEKNPQQACDQSKGLVCTILGCRKARAKQIKSILQSIYVGIVILSLMSFLLIPFYHGYWFWYFWTPVYDCIYAILIPTFAILSIVAILECAIINFTLFAATLLAILLMYFEFSIGVAIKEYLIADLKMNTGFVAVATLIFKIYEFQVKAKAEATVKVETAKAETAKVEVQKAEAQKAEAEAKVKTAEFEAQKAELEKTTAQTELETAQTNLKLRQMSDLFRTEAELALNASNQDFQISLQKRTELVEQVIRFLKPKLSDQDEGKDKSEVEDKDKSERSIPINSDQIRDFIYRFSIYFNDNGILLKVYETLRKSIVNDQSDAKDRINDEDILSLIKYFRRKLHSDSDVDNAHWAANKVSKSFGEDLKMENYHSAVMYLRYTFYIHKLPRRIHQEKGLGPWIDSCKITLEKYGFKSFLKDGKQFEIEAKLQDVMKHYYSKCLMVGVDSDDSSKIGDYIRSCNPNNDENGHSKIGGFKLKDLLSRSPENLSKQAVNKLLSFEYGLGDNLYFMKIKGALDYQKDSKSYDSFIARTSRYIQMPEDLGERIKLMVYADNRDTSDSFVGIFNIRRVYSSNDESSVFKYEIFNRFVIKSTCNEEYRLKNVFKTTDEKGNDRNKPGELLKRLGFPNKSGGNAIIKVDCGSIDWNSLSDLFVDLERGYQDHVDFNDRMILVNANMHLSKVQIFVRMHDKTVGQNKYIDLDVENPYPDKLLSYIDIIVSFVSRGKAFLRYNGEHQLNLMNTYVYDINFDVNSNNSVEYFEMEVLGAIDFSESTIRLGIKIENENLILEHVAESSNLEHIAESSNKDTIQMNSIAPELISNENHEDS